MLKKISIFVMMLLISATILPIAGSVECIKMSPGVIDQEQTDTSEQYFIQGGVPHSQEFVNLGKTIEEVQVHIGHYYSGSPPLTLSIEKPLGTILTSKTLTTADLPDHVQKWTTFDFPDVILDQNAKYYIVLYSDIGSEYAWSGAHGDPYPAGASSHPDIDWDFAFRTIVDKSRPRTVNIFFDFLQAHPILFQLLQRLLNL